MPLAGAQKVITYESGMGSRDPNDADTWILYQKVKAAHDGMLFYGDSALLNTVRNDLTAFRNIRLLVTDTTVIYGDRLYYDGNERVAYIWGRTVTLIDGGTTLTSDRLVYNRNDNTGYYETWGHAVNGADTLDSKEGLYDATAKVFIITREVRLRDTSTTLLTEEMVYNTVTKLARFEGPTHIYSDSSYLYSERGEYESDISLARSFKEGFARSGTRTLEGDTVFFNQQFQQGQAWGHVVVRDTAGGLTCYGMYGETDQVARLSMVTDSALVVHVSEGDTAWLHGDTIFVYNNEDEGVDSVLAYRNVRAFRRDGQGVCDSLVYVAADSVVRMYYEPVLWQDSSQAVADTIVLHLDSAGVRIADLIGGVMALQRMDSARYNQVKGKNGKVYLEGGEPSYADILGSAQMVFYITETQEDSTEALIGVNVGVGSDMRIYFAQRAPDRVSTYGSPDMQVYPPEKVPKEKERLLGFDWKERRRPRQPEDVMRMEPTARDESTEEKRPTVEKEPTEEKE